MRAGLPVERPHSPSTSTFAGTSGHLTRFDRRHRTARTVTHRVASPFAAFTLALVIVRSFQGTIFYHRTHTYCI